MIGFMTAVLTYNYSTRGDVEGQGLHGGATDMVHASLL
jgi:hypothetical protein